LLQAIVSFTDDLFSKTVVSMEQPDEQSASRQPGNTVEVSALQSALDELGIARPKALGWLPDGFEFDKFQIADARDSRNLAAQYRSGNKLVVLTVRVYGSPPKTVTRSHEKSAGEPIKYELSTTSSPTSARPLRLGLTACATATSRGIYPRKKSN
jgi:hypothetical protein